MEGHFHAVKGRVMLNKGIIYRRDSHMVFLLELFSKFLKYLMFIVSSVYKGVHPCSSLSLLCYGLGKVCRITPPTQSSKLHCTLLSSVFTVFVFIFVFVAVDTVTVFITLLFFADTSFFVIFAAAVLLCQTNLFLFTCFSNL